MQSQRHGRTLSMGAALLGAALCGLPLTAPAEIVLANAAFNEIAFCNRGPRVEGFDLGLPETVSVDFTGGSGQSCVATATASAFGPMGDTQVNSTGSGYDAGALVFVTYWFAIEPLVANAPDTPISVTTQVLGSASIQGSPTLGGSASAYFRVDLPDPLSASGSQTIEGLANLCGPDLGAGCTDGVTNADLSLQLVLMLPPGTSLQVDKQAGAGAGAGDTDNSVGAQAVVDPIFTITPGFLVDYNGTPTAATDLYRIVYSPGVTPAVSAVPAPAAGTLLATGVTALAG
ncbi:MAG: hypothetical protein J0M16_06205, partial [Gammaproteobacteria bacterium]|nr:hypothetical protein [Gammaproteobacteria bacterium]